MGDAVGCRVAPTVLGDGGVDGVAVVGAVVVAAVGGMLGLTVGDRVIGDSDMLYAIETI